MADLYETEKSLERAYESGRLTIDFPVEPFTDTGSLLKRSLKVYMENIAVIAKITLIVFIPFEIVAGIIVSELGTAEEMSPTQLAITVIPWILEALVAPAVIYALIFRFRGGGEAEPFECLKWGMRQWMRTLGNNTLAGLAIFAGLLLFIIPGVVLTIKFFLVEPIVAIEGDSQGHVLTRSREIADTRLWEIFGALLFSIMAFFAVTMVLTVPNAAIDHWVMDIAVNAAIAVMGMFITTLSLMIYLGLAHAAPAKPVEPEDTGPTIV